MKKFILLVILTLVPCLAYAVKCDKLFRPPFAIHQFNLVFKQIEALIQNPADWTNKEKAEKVRGFFFEIEGLSRVYEAVLENKKGGAIEEELNTIIEIHDLIKAQEDLIGHNFEKAEALEKIKKIDPEKLSPELKELLNFAEPKLSKESDTSLKLLAKKQEEDKWLVDINDRFEEINEKLLTISWPKKKEIRKLFKKSLGIDLKNLKKVIPIDPENPKGDQLSPDILEKGGTHEFRRKLRWISIHLLAMKYFVTYKNLDPEKLASIYADQKLTASDYTKSTAEYRKAIVIKRKYILALSRWIEVLGKAKDWGAIERELAYTARQKGIRNSHPAALKYARDLLKEVPGYVDFRVTTRQVMRQIHDTKFVEKLTNSLGG